MGRKRWSPDDVSNGSTCLGKKLSFLLKQLRKITEADFFKKPVGLEAGMLRVCPTTPNCVCSEDQRSLWNVRPLASKGENSLSQLAKILTDQMGAQIIIQTDTYLHAEFSSKFFGFVDDLELHIPNGANTVQIRSASRIGRSDLGVNRKRVETLRRIWEE